MGEVKLSNPDKVLFPDDGITKGEVAAYYDVMAPVILPHRAFSGASTSQKITVRLQ